MRESPGLLLVSSGVFAVVPEFRSDRSDNARRLYQIPKISILNFQYSPKLSGDVTPRKTPASANGQHPPAHSLKPSHNNCPALTNRRPIIGVVRFSFSPLTGSAGKNQAAPLFFESDQSARLRSRTFQDQAPLQYRPKHPLQARESAHMYNQFTKRRTRTLLTRPMAMNVNRTEVPP